MYRVLALLLILTAACAPAANSSTLNSEAGSAAQAEIVELQQPTPTTVPTATPTPVPSVTPDPALNPLTGLIVADPAVLNRRPFVVKISNAPALVRPQSGIGSADIVYEHYAEGGLTRFSAVFYSQAPERVGSIRSARLIDNQLLPMYGALLGYSGASDGVNQILHSADYANRLYEGIRYGAPYYWRDESLAVPHNMFLSLPALWQLATEEGINTRPELGGMTFDLYVPPNSAGAAGAIDVRYRATLAHWDYHSDTGLYYRFSDGVPHNDANTGAQITASNVVVIYASHAETDIVESVWNNSPSYSIEITLIGEGSAILFRDGQRYECRWVRADRESRLTLVTLDGQPMPFRPGNTWFQLVRLPEQMDSASEWVTWG
jgi:hypothetical protein